ncbi:hypothetical protein DYH09_07660 [bacterium CPR1]|nr:hypothetical protein [bacterium CPR1]
MRLAELLLVLLLALPVEAQPPAETQPESGAEEIRVYLDPGGELRLENPPAQEIELTPTLSRNEPPSYTVYPNWLWYDPWEDPGWLYLYGRYPTPFDPDYWPGPNGWLGPWW